MNITIINQFYLPDSAPTAQLAGSLAEYLVSRGHRVTVVCGQAVYSGEPIDDNNTYGVHLNRLWTPGFGKRKVIYRITDYITFYLQTMICLLYMPRQDIIISLTTPPFIALSGLVHKLIKRKTKLILWNMDSYPEIAEMTGHLRRSSILSKLLRSANKLLFRNLDAIVALDNAMAESLAKSYLAHTPINRKPKLKVIPNWERLSMFPPRTDLQQVKQSSQLNHIAEKFVILYLGNAGNAHEFETILQAAEQLRHEPITFLFVGGGAKWTELERARDQRHLKNLELRGYIPKEATRELMANCHLALITLHEAACGLVSPSKLHAYLALSLPVLYIGPEGSNVDDAIRDHHVGYSLRMGDTNGVVSTIRTLRMNANLLSELRIQARSAFETYYCDEKTTEQFENIIHEVVKFGKN